MDKMMDDDVRALVLELKAMADRLRAKGLDDDDLKDLLLVKDEKGIALSPDGTLSLLDYGRKVKLSPMERALYTRGFWPRTCGSTTTSSLESTEG